MEQILCAFLLGGCLCALFQVIGSFTKGIPPKILLLGIAAGAFMGALGITTALGTFSPAGIGIMVIGFGDVVFGAVQGALVGNWVPTVVVVCVVLVFWFIGIATALVRLSVSKQGNK